MTRKRSSPMGLEIYLSAMLAFIMLPLLVQAAPLQDYTEIQQYTEGCYYNYNHYNEGDRIMTNEPCLNCTCHNKMLMCYLRVCPFTKPIGHDCIVEKREDQCCPIITCPEVPVDVAHSAPEPGTELSFPEKFGCSIEGNFYLEGAQVPSNPNKPCELCYCIKNRTSCLMQECTLHIDGCTPIYNKGSCCPVRYNCDHENDVLELEDLSTTTEAATTTTTVRPTTGFIITSTMSPSVSTDCVHNSELYADGARIVGETACENCYCMRGDIICAVQECHMPMLAGIEKNCHAMPAAEGECCPSNYVCEDDTATNQIIESTTLPYADLDEAVKITTTAPVKDLHSAIPEEDLQLQTHIDDEESATNAPSTDEEKETVADGSGDIKPTDIPSAAEKPKDEEQEVATKAIEESDSTTVSTSTATEGEQNVTEPPSVVDKLPTASTEAASDVEEEDKPEKTDEYVTKAPTQEEEEEKEAEKVTAIAADEVPELSTEPSVDAFATHTTELPAAVSDIAQEGKPEDIESPESEESTESADKETKPDAAGEMVTKAPMAAEENVAGEQSEEEPKPVTTDESITKAPLTEEDVSIEASEQEQKPIESDESVKAPIANETNKPEEASHTGDVTELPEQDEIVTKATVESSEEQEGSGEETDELSTIAPTDEEKKPEADEYQEVSTNAAITETKTTSTTTAPLPTISKDEELSTEGPKEDGKPVESEGVHPVTDAHITDEEITSTTPVPVKTISEDEKLSTEVPKEEAKPVESEEHPDTDASITDEEMASSTAAPIKTISNNEELSTEGPKDDGKPVTSEEEQQEASTEFPKSKVEEQDINKETKPELAAVPPIETEDEPEKSTETSAEFTEADIDATTIPPTLDEDKEMVTTVPADEISTRSPMSAEEDQDISTEYPEENKLSESSGEGIPGSSDELPLNTTTVAPAKSGVEEDLSPETPEDHKLIGSEFGSDDYATESSAEETSQSPSTTTSTEAAISVSQKEEQKPIEDKLSEEEKQTSTAATMDTSEASIESEEDNKLDVTTIKTFAAEESEEAETSAEQTTTDSKVDSTTTKTVDDKMTETETSVNKDIPSGEQHKDNLPSEITTETYVAVDTSSIPTVDKDSSEEDSSEEDKTLPESIKESEEVSTVAPAIEIITEAEEDQHRVMPESDDHKAEEQPEEQIGITDSPMVIIEDMSDTTPEHTSTEGIKTESEVDKEQQPEATTVAPTFGTSENAEDLPSVDTRVDSDEEVPATTVKTVTAEEISDMELPSVIPGEGDCLVGQKTYENNTVIPTTDECEITCRCISSIISCERVKCEVPYNIDQCTLDKASTNKCCPSYICGTDGIPAKTDDSSESVKEDDDEEIKYTTIALPTEQPTKKSDQKSEDTTDKPDNAPEESITVAIPEIEMDISSTEEPMSHVKDNDEIEQHTPKLPVTDLAEDKKDVVTDSEVSTTPATTVEDNIVPQPIDTSEKEIDQEIATETVPVDISHDIPIDQQQPEKEIEEQTTSASISVDGITDSSEHASSEEENDDKKVSATTVTPSSDIYPTVKPLEKDDNEKKTSDEIMDHTSQPTVSKDEIQSTTATVEKIETETVTAIPTLFTDGEQETQTVLPVDIDKEISDEHAAIPSQSSEMDDKIIDSPTASSKNDETSEETQTAAPIATDNISVETEATPSAAKPTSEEPTSSTESTEDISLGSTVAPSTDQYKESEKEDIDHTTYVPAITDTDEQLSTDAPKQPSEEPIGPIFEEPQISSTAATISEEEKEEDYSDSISTEQSVDEDASEISVAPVFDGDKEVDTETHTVPPLTIDQDTPTEEGKPIKQDIESTTAAPSTETVTTLADSSVPHDEQSSKEDSHTVSVPAMDEEISSQTTAASNEVSDEETSDNPINLATKIDTSSEGVNTSTDKPIDFETKVDTSVKKDKDEKESIEEHTEPTSMEPAATMEPTAEETADVTTPVEDGIRKITTASSVHQGEPDESIETTFPSVEKATESSEEISDENVTLPTIEQDKELEPSMAHTMASIVDGKEKDQPAATVSDDQQFETSSPISLEGHPEEAVDSVTKIPTTSIDSSDEDASEISVAPVFDGDKEVDTETHSVPPLTIDQDTPTEEGKPIKQDIESTTAAPSSETVTPLADASVPHDEQSSKEDSHTVSVPAMDEEISSQTTAASNEVSDEETSDNPINLATKIDTSSEGVNTSTDKPIDFETKVDASVKKDKDEKESIEEHTEPTSMEPAATMEPTAEETADVTTPVEDSIRKITTASSVHQGEPDESIETTFPSVEKATESSEEISDENVTLPTIEQDKELEPSMAHTMASIVDGKEKDQPAATVSDDQQFETSSPISLEGHPEEAVDSVTKIPTTSIDSSDEDASEISVAPVFDGDKEVDTETHSVPLLTIDQDTPTEEGKPIKQDIESTTAAPSSETVTPLADASVPHDEQSSKEDSHTVSVPAMDEEISSQTTAASNEVSDEETSENPINLATKIDTSSEGVNTSTDKSIDFETKVDTSVKKDKDEKESIEEHTEPTSMEPAATMEPTAEETADVTTPVEDGIRKITTASSVHQGEPDESIETTFPSVEKATESSEEISDENVTLPTIEQDKELEPSMAHTMASIVDGKEKDQPAATVSDDQQFETSSPISLEVHPEEAVDSVTKISTTSIDSSEEESTNKNDMAPEKEDTIIPEFDMDKHISPVDGFTTIAPVVDDEAQSSIAPFKQPAVDFSEEESGESVESEEEFTTETPKIQHIGEFVTERVEESTAKPSVHPITEEKEASGEEGEDIELTTDIPQLTSEKEHEDKYDVTTSVPVKESDMPKDIKVSTEKLSEDEENITSAVTKAPTSEGVSGVTMGAEDVEEVGNKLSEEDDVSSATKAPFTDEDVEGVTPEQVEENVVLSVTKAPEDVEGFTNAKQEQEDVPPTATNTPFAPEDATAVPAEGVIPAVTKAPLTAEGITVPTDKVSDQEEVLPAVDTTSEHPEDIVPSDTKAPFTDEDIESTTDEIPEQEGFPILSTNTPFAQENIEDVKGEHAEHVIPSITKAPFAAEDTEGFTDEILKQEDVPSSTTNAPFAKENVTAEQAEDDVAPSVTKTPIDSEDITGEQTFTSVTKPSMDVEDIESATAQQPIQEDGVSSTTKAPFSTEDIEDVTTQKSDEQDVDLSKAPIASEGVDIVEDQKHEDKEDLSAITNAPMDAEDIDTSTPKISDDKEDISTITKSPVASDEIYTVAPQLSKEDGTDNITQAQETSEETEHTTDKLPTQESFGISEPAVTHAPSSAGKQPEQQDNVPAITRTPLIDEDSATKQPEQEGVSNVSPITEAPVSPEDIGITSGKPSKESVASDTTNAPETSELEVTTAKLQPEQSDEIPEDTVTQVPTTDVEEDKSDEVSTHAPKIPEEHYEAAEPTTVKLPDLAEHITELPTKDTDKQTEEEATELPLLAVEAPTVGQTAEQSTESSEELSTEEVTEDKLRPTTTVHPLFSHITTMASAVIDSRIDNTNATDSSVVPAKDAEEEQESFTTIPPTSSTSTTSAPITTSAPHYQPQPPVYGQPPQYEDEYTDDDEGEVFGPGTCRYGGKLYVSAQQIPRDDPCDFCFCFRSDIICLQQSCPPPISGCHEEPISGFCCPRYECPVSMAAVLNITTSTTTTSTTLPPHFLHHSYGNNVQRNGCLIEGRSYRVGEKIESKSGPCINCTCGGDGNMKCDPQACVPEPTMQQVMAVVAAGRKR